MILIQTNNYLQQTKFTHFFFQIVSFKPSSARIASVCAPTAGISPITGSVPGMVIAFEDIGIFLSVLAQRLHVIHDRIQVRVAQLHRGHQRPALERVW